MSSPPAAESVDIPLRVKKMTALSGEVPAPPKPLQDASGYTKDRLELGLEYANAVIRINGRNLSPIGRRTLSIYKEACTQLLLLNEGDYMDIKGVEKVRSELLGTIRMFEESRAYKACLTVTESKHSEELAKEILRLQRTTFYARYGDVFGDARKLLRHEAEAGKVTVWSGLNQRYWTTISKTLIAEKPWFIRDHPRYPENPQTWVATHALQMRTDELCGPNPRDEGKVNKEIHEEIHKALAQRLRSERKSREMSSRVASAELDGEMERAKRQKREWDRLQNITSNVHSLKVAYENSWGKMLPPVNPTADPWMGGMESEPALESASESEFEPEHKPTPSSSPTPEMMDVIEPDTIMGLGDGIGDGDIQLGGSDSEYEPEEYNMY
ncbi:hypothetical protein VC83_06103 [Pseudogymnoascus destructans]|uniref:Uncharacterized protein n=1 Tax=Pseudogymnoascus destructans TaxID=655981 RepID=A0A177A9G1_9PEZI|nr:uncharacterized protein VC83_06103 [Pseudogymnoascus destructans]OAF58757.1 hypothetical protein VC83_06103 [Pseudogymnoascus destructans]